MILSFTFESEHEVPSPNETCVIWDHDVGIMERNRSSLIDTSPLEVSRQGGSADMLRTVSALQLQRRKTAQLDGVLQPGRSLLYSG